jgi:hypothetical protein
MSAISFAKAGVKAFTREKPHVCYFALVIDKLTDRRAFQVIDHDSGRHLDFKRL